MRPSDGNNSLPSRSNMGRRIRDLSRSFSRNKGVLIIAREIEQDLKYGETALQVFSPLISPLPELKQPSSSYRLPLKNSRVVVDSWDLPVGQSWCPKHQALPTLIMVGGQFPFYFLRIIASYSFRRRGPQQPEIWSAGCVVGVLSRCHFEGYYCNWKGRVSASILYSFTLLVVLIAYCLRYRTFWEMERIRLPSK